MSNQITLGIKRLEVVTWIGVNPHEKLAPQKLYLTLALTCDLPSDDQLSSTIDYDSVAQVCQHICASKQRELIDTLAQDLLLAIKTRFPVRKIKILIEKPSAIPDAECAFTEYEQEVVR